MSTVSKQLRSSFGFESPYFIVDTQGNLITQTITVTGSRLELSNGSYLSYGGKPLLTQTALGSTVTNIPGTLTGLTVGSVIFPATLNVVGALNVTGNLITVIKPTTVGNIDNIVVGASVPAAGTFTNLTITNSLTTTLNTLTLSPALGITLGTAGQSTTILGNVSLTGTQNITIAPADGSTLTIVPTKTGTIDNVTIGATTPVTGNFTTVTQTAPNEKWNSAVKSQTATKRYAENVSVALHFFAMGQ
jgi:hypothetical protein